MLSERIKELRKLNGYSQQQMAQKLHLTQGAISQWETGMTLPSAEQLGALADVFGITVDELLERKPQDEQDEVMQIREMLRRDPSYAKRFRKGSNEVRKINKKSPCRSRGLIIDYYLISGGCSSPMISSTFGSSSGNTLFQMGRL